MRNVERGPDARAIAVTRRAFRYAKRAERGVDQFAGPTAVPPACR
jgi:hypothetical protein